MEQNSPPRKQNVNIGELREIMREVAKADGVKLQERRSPLPTVSPATPSNVAAVRQSLSPVNNNSLSMSNAGEELKANAFQPANALHSKPGYASTSEVASGEFNVDLDLLDPLPTSSRFDYTNDEVDELLRQLAKEGRQLKPIELTQSDTDPNRYYVVDGYTRMLALRKWGKLTARAVIIVVSDPWERYKASWYANNGSRYTTDYDNGMRWRDMIDKGIITQPAISVSLHDKFSAGNVSRILSITKLSADARNFIRDHKQKLSSKFYYTIYLATSKVPDREKEEMVITSLRRIIDEDMSIRELQTYVERQVKVLAAASCAQVSGQSSAPQSRSLLLNGREVGAVKEWPVGDRLQISLKGVPVDLREEVKEAVSRILAKGKAETEPANI